MRLTHFFIDRPRFAVVLSTFVTLLGIGALAVLPVAQYPEVVPPTVQITTSYPGASAETIARTVATPLEQQISADQRRRKHALHEQPVDRRREPHYNGDVPYRDRPEHLSDANPESRAGRASETT